VIDKDHSRSRIMDPTAARRSFHELADDLDFESHDVHDVSGRLTCNHISEVTFSLASDQDDSRPSFAYIDSNISNPSIYEGGDPAEEQVMGRPTASFAGPMDQQMMED
jgi:hypothetical protein